MAAVWSDFLVLGVVGANKKIDFYHTGVGRLVLRVGGASYTLYLVHWFVLSLAGKALHFIPYSSFGLTVLWHFFSIMTAVFIAVIFAENIELPIHKMIVKRVRRTSLLS